MRPLVCSRTRDQEWQSLPQLKELKRAPANSLQREPMSLLFPADLRDHALTQSLVREVLARFGRLDILVNNAGMTQIGSPTETTSLPLAELSEKEWDYSIALNLKTAFNITKAVLPFMLSSELWAYRERFFRHRSCRQQPSRNRLQCGESRHRWDDSQSCPRSCPQRNHCKRRRPWLDRNRVLYSCTNSSRAQILPSAALVALTRSPPRSRFLLPNPPRTSRGN